MDTVNYGLIFTGIFLFIGISFSRSKFVAALELGWVAVLTCGNSGGADFLGNLSIYLGASSDTFDGVYSGLAGIFRNHNIEYTTFNGIVAFVATCIVGIIILKYSQRPALTVCFLIIFPMVDDIVQKRWYPAMAIVILGISLLIKNNKSYTRIIVYLLLCVIAIQIHTGTLLFLTLPFFLLLPSPTQKVVSLCIFLLGTAGRSILPTILGSTVFGGLASRNELYFGTLAQTASFSHYLFWLFWQGAQMAIIWYLRRKDPDNNLIEFVWKINIWSFMVIPLYSFNPVFTRIFRVILIFNFIVVGNGVKIERSQGVRISTLTAIAAQLALCVVSFLVMDVLTSSSLGFDQIVSPIFTQNLFLK